MIDRDSAEPCSPEPAVDPRRQRTRYFDLLLGLTALAGLALWFRSQQLGAYFQADTLLNYEQGFYRRALLGNLFLSLPAWLSVSAAMKGVYAGSLAAVFVLAVRFVRTTIAWRLRLVLCTVITIFPFGVLFYLKDVLAIRKELLFFPLLVLFSFSRPWSRTGVNLAAIGVTLVGCLIHESCLFLVLPFLLSVLWLEGRLNWPWLGAHVVFALGLNVTIMAFSVGPDGPVNDAVQACIALGFQPEELANFIRYNSLPPAENIAKSVRHLSNPTLVLYLGLFLVQEVLVLSLPRVFGCRLIFSEPRKLLICLSGLAFGAAVLFGLGMDYGRWLTFSFILGCILIASQVERVAVRAGPRRPALIALWLVTGCLLVLFSRAPHYTTRFRLLEEWTTLATWKAWLR